MSVNKVILIGNLGADPEVRHLDSNRVVANFRIATNETYNDRNGEKKTETEWFNIEMWDNQAKVAEKYLRKGSQIFIEGKLRTESWKDKDGNDRSRMKVRVQNFTLLGGRPGSDGGNGTSAPSSGNTPPYSPPAENHDEPSLTDDLPF